ncbi:MAG: hypothetical protein ACHQT9_03900 [Candidatus Saccharimonadales bacterium]
MLGSGNWSPLPPRSSLNEGGHYALWADVDDAMQQPGVPVEDRLSEAQALLSGSPDTQSGVRVISPQRVTEILSREVRLQY